MKPTEETYSEMQAAYDFFNKTLFVGLLPNCLITLQRKKSTLGYFSHNRFVNKEGEQIDEIAMNPSFFSIRTIEETLSTLAHEMTHKYQQNFGKPGRGRYHNKEWGDKMIEIGLMPSSTGKEGGKKTGDRMSHYIIKGGAFEKACKQLITSDFKLSWADRFPPYQMIDRTPAPDEGGGLIIDDEEDADIDSAIDEMKSWGIDIEKNPPTPPPPTRVKFTCPECQSSAWGKPSLNLICGDCKVQYRGSL